MLHRSTVEQFTDELPLGYQVALGGAVEDSANSLGPILATMPLMLLIMAIILMLQLQSFSRLFLVFAVAPCDGMALWKAVVEATEHRMRPILRTAATASLVLIPISRDVFWGPLAYAMMGGTILTLLFLPALYLVAFRISPESPQVLSNSAG